MSRKYYCGPDWLPEILRPKFFNRQCKVHDRVYELGASTREKADKRFLRQMLRVAPNLFRKIEAWTLFIIVRLLGWIYYGR